MKGVTESPITDQAFYDGVLKGLAVFYDSPFIENIRQAAFAYSRQHLESALNRHQMASKRWLLEELCKVAGGRLGVVYILGGWYGVLAAMILERHPLEVEAVCSFDWDPSCAPVALHLNRHHAGGEGKFYAFTQDVLAIDYLHPRFAVDDRGRCHTFSKRADVIINTGCEHLPDLPALLSRLPRDALLVLQSNDYFGQETHVNCVEDLAEFKQQVALSEVLFAGSLKAKRYTRFMVIGRK